MYLLNQDAKKDSGAAAFLWGASFLHIGRCLLSAALLLSPTNVPLPILQHPHHQVPRRLPNPCFQGDHNVTSYWQCLHPPTRLTPCSWQNGPNLLLRPTPSLFHSCKLCLVMPKPPLVAIHIFLLKCLITSPLSRLTRGQRSQMADVSPGFLFWPENVWSARVIHPSLGLEAGVRRPAKHLRHIPALLSNIKTRLRCRHCSCTIIFQCWEIGPSCPCEKDLVRRKKLSSWNILKALVINSRTRFSGFRILKSCQQS